MTSLATGLSCDEYAPFLFSFGLLLYKQGLLVARLLGTQCVKETVSVFLQKCSLYPSMVKAAGAMFCLQTLPIPSVVGNSGARVQEAGIRRLSLESYPVSAFQKPDQAQISECDCHHLPLRDSFFYQSEEQDCFSSSTVLLPLSLPSTTAGIRKGRGC